MNITPAAELAQRIDRFQALLKDHELDGAFILQNADLFYFSGTIQQGVLYLPADGEPLYMVRKEFSRAKVESGLKNIVAIRGFRDLRQCLADFGHPLPEKAGMELDVVPVALYQRLCANFPKCRMTDVTPLIREVRAIKSEFEIAAMRVAAAMVDKIFLQAREVIRSGKTDMEVVAELEFTARRLGHQGITRMRSFNSEIFMGQFMSGADAGVPSSADTPLGGPGLNPYVGRGSGWKKIAPGEPILFDFTGTAEGYLSDMTRIFCIGGLDDDLLRAYDDMVAVQQLMKQTARPGCKWGEVYEVCCELARRQGHGEHFMGAPGAQVSFIGHGIGLEIDEYPFIAKGFMDYELRKNMTFAFEPKVVFPGRGALGIENSFCVTEDGVEALTFSDEQLVVI
ncbi:MAG: aminopeptidase P family protein [Desulfuromonadaceae bacterium]|nr:aminopeptidase P family protein [Desulfuromonadaceae bacterium]